MAKKPANQPPKLSDVLRDAVRRSLDAQQFTRRALCRAAGVEESTLCRFLIGRALPSAKSIDRLCNVLRLSLVPDESPESRRRRRSPKKSKRKRSKRSLPTLDTSGLKAWPG